jgi:hypothetical protein
MDMQVLNSFIQSIQWWTLVPSGLDGMKNFITDGGGSDTGTDFVAAAANKDGTLLVAYIPPDHTGSITLDMTVFKENIKAYWIDPTNGKSTEIKGSPFINRGASQFTPPGSNLNGQNDWVLEMIATPK